MVTHLKLSRSLEGVPRVNEIVRMSLKRYSLFKSSPVLKRLGIALFMPLVILGLIILFPDSSQAASGGRIGGGSFRGPSMPSGGGMYRGGGGYRGGYGYGPGYRRGGGIGFPFILPIFGFGGGGLFGFLILMSIVGAMVNAVRGSNTQSISSNQLIERPQGPVTLTQLQIGLLASAKELQGDLRKLAASSDTSNTSGLQKVLQETTLSLLRQPDFWVYSNIETGTVPFHSAESTFNRLSITERGKLSAEVTSNVAGQRNTAFSSSLAPGEADESNEFIVVTILLASKGSPKINISNNAEELKENLRVLGATSSTDLMALEVIWQPDGTRDSLSSEELVTAYPNLHHL